VAEKSPTFDPPAQTDLKPGVAPEIHEQATKVEIVNALESYRLEATNNRQSGLNPRDDKWRENLNLYWNRYDFKEKASWQAKETLAEVPNYVDRFAAAMKEAMISSPGGFYTVTDPADAEGDMTTAVKKITDAWLTRVGRNQLGQVMPFTAVFEEQMKLGAIMMMSAVVTWKNDVPKGRVAIETVDPQNVWLDHTYRNLYRVRRIELDRHDLKKMITMKDSKGKALFDLQEIDRLTGQMLEDKRKREELTGTGQNVSSGRSPITLDEYVATVVDARGELIADRGLFVVANQQFLIRGPEPNPFWHGSDWLVASPLIDAPLSPYGRSYMEDFGSIARTFTELTNMLLDAIHVTALKAFAVVPGILLNASQVAGGITANKTFMLQEGYKPEDFARAIDLGTLPPDAVKMWELLKNELSEAANMNEVALGQFAPKGRTSATEISETKQSSSALIRSIAQTVEQRWLNIILDLTWKTGLQHAKEDDPLLNNAAGAMWPALWANRKELIQRPLTFQAGGISALIRKAAQMKALIGIMQLVASNDLLLQEFMKVVDINKFVKKLFELSDIDLQTLNVSDRERLIRGVTEPMGGLQQQAGGQGAPPAEGGQASPEMTELARSMGVAS